MASSRLHSLFLSLLLCVPLAGAPEDLREQFEALQNGHKAQTAAVKSSMDQLYWQHLDALQLQASQTGDYAAAQFYKEALKEAEAADSNLTLTFYPEEAELSGSLKLSLDRDHALSNWSTPASAQWNRFPIPAGGYAVTLVYSSNRSGVTARVQETKYHVEGELAPSKEGTAQASLGNLRFGASAKELTLTLPQGAASGIIIHQLILESHAR